jgi:hypothetical protein
LSVEVGAGSCHETGARHFSPPRPIASVAMQDLTMLFFTALFFVLAFLYVKACQKLR